MRHAQLSFVLAAVAAAGGIANAEIPGKKLAPSRLTADAIVQRHLQALGGVEVMRATTSMTFTTTERRDDGTVSVRRIDRARPGLVRVEVKEGDNVAVKAFDGKQGWFMKNGRAEIMPADGSEHMRMYAEFDDALLDYAKRGVKVELLGTDQLAGGKAYKLRVTMASGESELRWIDAASYFEVQRVLSYSHDGKTFEKKIAFGDYRRIDGQMVNHSVAWEADGKKGSYAIGEVAFNKQFAANHFATPAGATPMKVDPAAVVAEKKK